MSERTTDLWPNEHIARGADRAEAALTAYADGLGGDFWMSPADFIRSFLLDTMRLIDRERAEEIPRMRISLEQLAIAARGTGIAERTDDTASPESHLGAVEAIARHLQTPHSIVNFQGQWAVRLGLGKAERSIFAGSNPDGDVVASWGKCFTLYTDDPIETATGMNVHENGPREIAAMLDVMYLSPLPAYVNDAEGSR